MSTLLAAACVRIELADLETRLIRWMVGAVSATATFAVWILRLIGTYGSSFRLRFLIGAPGELTLAHGRARPSLSLPPPSVELSPERCGRVMGTSTSGRRDRHARQT